MTKQQEQQLIADMAAANKGKRPQQDELWREFITALCMLVIYLATSDEEGDQP